jgi:hypothetical protein
MGKTGDYRRKNEREQPMSNKQESTSGQYLLVGMFLIFLTLKLYGVIDWSWVVGNSTSLDAIHFRHHADD